MYTGNLSNIYTRALFKKKRKHQALFDIIGTVFVTLLVVIMTLLN